MPDSDIRDEYNVCFIGDHFSMNVFVQGVEFPNEEYDEDVVIDLASNIIQYQYGWDIKAVSTVAIEVEGA